MSEAAADNNPVPVTSRAKQSYIVLGDLLWVEEDCRAEYGSGYKSNSYGRGEQHQRHGRAL